MPSRTSHVHQIARIRRVAGNAPPGRFKNQLEAAAALLEVHDDTGISLDNWIGPREFVNGVLDDLGFGPFTPNGV